MCGLQKGSLQQVHLLVLYTWMIELIYAQSGRIPWGQASAVVSAWDAYTQPLDRTMMKGAELEIKMNFHAGMPLVYNSPLIQYFVYVEHEVVSMDD